MIQVLIVDDEKLEREGIKYLLAMEEGEWNIREASNGRDALQILKNEETDLLLTDIKMPHIDVYKRQGVGSLRKKGRETENRRKSTGAADGG